VNSSDPTPPAHEGREYWLPTLQLAMQEVFDLMLACPLEVPPTPPPEAILDITSMVGLSGQLCGILTVRCSARTAARMAARMLGIDAEKAQPEMFDAVGEICNMVAGNFKNKITGLGDGCMLSVPTVLTGVEPGLGSTINDMRSGEMNINDEIQTVRLFEGEPIVLTLEIHS
jgi:hypothetical protein